MGGLFVLLPLIEKKVLQRGEEERGEGRGEERSGGKWRGEEREEREGKRGERGREKEILPCAIT